MPYQAKARRCKQKSTGKSGTHVVVKKKRNGGTEQISCHTSEDKADAAVRGHYARKNEGAFGDTMNESIRQIVREALEESKATNLEKNECSDLSALIRESMQDLSKPIPIDQLKFVDEEGNGSMMLPGVGYSYSVREEDFEAEKQKIKQRFGSDVMISVPNPGYPKSKKLHSSKFEKAQSRENQNFMRHQRMMRRRLGRNPSLGS